MASKPKVFFTFGAGDVRSIAGIRQERDGSPQPLAKAIPDGDTLSIHLDGSGGVRFLGIDTPEKSFELAGAGRPSLDDDAWATYLADPFAPQFGSFDVEAGLKAHLQGRANALAGINHHKHGLSARDTLTALVQSDMTALNQAPAEFQFFLAFSYEVFDRYGRFLAFINRNQPEATPTNPRPLNYNERMLEAGASLPYFIWPNIAPFRNADTVMDSIVPVGGAADLAQSNTALRRARDFVKAARAAGIGLFDPADPLLFEAFEIRYLGRRRPPSRPLIDLSKNDNVILRAQNYYTVPNPEDRLFIPMELVYAFVAKGWRLEGWS